jgi:hypothetical protein
MDRFIHALTILTAAVLEIYISDGKTVYAYCTATTLVANVIPISIDAEDKLKICIATAFSTFHVTPTTNIIPPETVLCITVTVLLRYHELGHRTIDI